MAATAAGSRADFGAGQLFLADSRLAFAVLNEVRVRTLQRVFGISREQANLVTLVLIVTGTGTAVTTAGRVVKAPLRISGKDVAIGGFAMREAAMSASGPAAASISPFGTLMTIAVLGGLAVPTLRRSLHRMREIEHRVRLQRERHYASARGAVKSRLG